VLTEFIQYYQYSVRCYCNICIEKFWTRTSYFFILSQVWSDTTQDREGGRKVQRGNPLIMSEEVNAYVCDWSVLKVTRELGAGNSNAAW